LRIVIGKKRREAIKESFAEVFQDLRGDLAIRFEETCKRGGMKGKSFVFRERLSWKIQWSA